MNERFGLDHWECRVSSLRLGDSFLRMTRVILTDNRKPRSQTLPPLVLNNGGPVAFLAAEPRAKTRWLFFYILRHQFLELCPDIFRAILGEFLMKVLKGVSELAFPGAQQRIISRVKKERGGRRTSEGD